MNKIKVIEPDSFAKNRAKYMNNQQFRLFADYLTMHPEMGTIVKGTGGCRKIRWRYQHCGKTGGIRIIYHLNRHSVIHLMFIYVKNRQKELTMKQRQECKAMVRELCS